MNQLSQIASVTDAGAAAVALVVASLGGPAHQATTGHAGQSAAGSSAVQTQALSFATSNSSITVTVRDPLADPAKYRRLGVRARRGHARNERHRRDGLAGPGATTGTRRHGPVFNYIDTSGIATHLRPDQVSGSWYVYDAIPWASDQVMLFVGQTAKQPASGSPSAK
jgi:hypothetical protein